MQGKRFKLPKYNYMVVKEAWRKKSFTPRRKILTLASIDQSPLPPKAGEGP